MARLGWTETDVNCRLMHDPGKLALATRVRQGTTAGAGRVKFPSMNVRDSSPGGLVRISRRSGWIFGPVQSLVLRGTWANTVKGLYSRTWNG